jgi:hypothetical protein
MAGLTHFAVGLAAKPAAPKIPLALLILSAYVIDIVWGIFFLAGFKAANPWSHSLFMAVIWSLLGGLLAWRIVDRRAGLVIGLLVFSHWLVDFISHPMTAVFPDDTGLPIFFADSTLVGLGAWRTQLGVAVGEYGVFILGLAIYIVTLRRLRRQNKARLAQFEK